MLTLDSNLGDLVPMLQTAISPVILISGVGLLLLTMTNRLGRTIDRARELSDEIRKGNPGERQKILEQLNILWQRARLIRLAIILSAGSALFAAFLIIAIFVSAILGLDAGKLITAVFGMCLLLLVGSLALFIREVNQSLSALKLEMKSAGIE